MDSDGIERCPNWQVSWLVQNTLPTDPFGDYDAFFEDHAGNPIQPDLQLVRDLCKAHSSAHPLRVAQILGTYGFKWDYTAPYWPQVEQNKQNEENNQ